MPTHTVDCPDCGKPVDYWRDRCRCGCFIGFPNRRQADADRPELMQRYDAARADARARGAEPLLDKLEALADQTLPVIAMSFAACDDILRAKKYRNYEWRTASGEQDPAGPPDHADRMKVGAQLYPMYQQHIHYAALSPDGRGLTSYGPVAMRWRVTPSYLGRRASLLEEDSFKFYDRHSLGGLGAAVPAGYRAAWEDRARLAAAKLAPRLTAATGEGALPRLLLHAGPTHGDNEFIEMAIYTQEGLDTEDVDRVTLLRAAATPEEGDRQDLIRAACAARSIVLVE
jgi:hypothetical protein